MHLFDFLFYKIYKYYHEIREKGAESSSAGIIGGLQSLNLLTIILIIKYLQKKEVNINPFPASEGDYCIEVADRNIIPIKLYP